MLVKKAPDLTYKDVTPRTLYMGRRNFLFGVAAAYGAVVGYKKLTRLLEGPATGSTPVKLSGVTKWPGSTTEKETSLEDVTHYNNFYEFGTSKTDPAANSRNFVTTPWSVSVEGEVKNKRTFSMDEIMKLAPLEERIYRHRCVEGWSIVVPYVEGLRLDEAMNPLTLLTVGMYDETLPNQDGAPVRLVIPWKYGFKSIKSLVRIRFVKDQPPTTWNITNAHEYGFYSNVNPTVDHPRWSQATERRLGEFRRRPTLMFNGYGDQVASMYSGMDLKKYY